MKLIEWRKEFELGIPHVDHEHEELVGLINELYKSLYSDHADTTVPDFLGELYARIASHFALEEREMREQRYDKYAEHKADHERLVDEIRDLMDVYEQGRDVDIDKFSRALEHWFSEHFRTHDARLHERLG